MIELIVIHDAPYGNEKAYNALRHAMTMQIEHPEVKVRIFLIADSVACALLNQIAPERDYDIEKMLKSIILKGGEVKLCSTCMDARGLKSSSLIKGAQRSTMSVFADWVITSDKIISF